MQLILLASCLVLGNPVYCQKINIASDIKEDKASAITFEWGENHQTVLLLLSSLNKGESTFQAFLLDSILNIKKRGISVKLDANTGSYKNKVKFMGKYQDQQNGYLWWYFTNEYGSFIWQVKINFENLTFKIKKTFNCQMGEEWWGGTTCNSKFYLFGRDKKRKEGLILNTYRFDPVSEKFEQRYVPIPNGSVCGDKNFSVLVQQNEPYYARQNQIFVVDNTLWLISEKEKGIINLIIIDPDILTLTEKQFPNTGGLEAAKAQSVILDGKIFRLLTYPKKFSISIHEIEEGYPVFVDSVTTREDKVRLFSMPIKLIKTRTLFNKALQQVIDRDTFYIENPRNFFEEADQCQLLLSVSKIRECYKIRVLGYNSEQGLEGVPDILEKSFIPFANAVTNYSNLDALVVLDKNMNKVNDWKETQLHGIPNKKKEPQAIQTYVLHSMYLKKYLGTWNTETKSYSLNYVEY
ncbi:MAG: hypothetical protein H7246_22615 [Phycisphaerae bacterium]|nr:hypothetical protein [Saprospiraceae bacterium]